MWFAGFLGENDILNIAVIIWLQFSFYGLWIHNPTTILAKFKNLYKWIRIVSKILWKLSNSLNVFWSELGSWNFLDFFVGKNQPHTMGNIIRLNNFCRTNIFILVKRIFTLDIFSIKHREPIFRWSKKQFSRLLSLMFYLPYLSCIIKFSSPCFTHFYISGNNLYSVIQRLIWLTFNKLSVIKVFTKTLKFFSEDTQMHIILFLSGNNECTHKECF